jgi:multiple sugar transport system substrate-binding protein
MLRSGILPPARADGLRPAFEAFTNETGTPVEIVELPPADSEGAPDHAGLNQTCDALLAPVGSLHAWRQKLKPVDDMATADLLPFASRPCRDGASWYCLPARVDFRLLYFRAELLGDRREQERFRVTTGGELSTPADWAAFAFAARHFTRPPQLYGTAFAGTDQGLTRFFLEVVHSLGGRAFDAGGRPRLATREAEAAASLIFDLHSRWSTTLPDLLELDPAAVAERFRQGRAALAIDGPEGFRRTCDPTFSAVAGWFGLAALPGTRPPRRRSWPDVMAMAIPEGSGRSDAARALVRYLLSDSGQQAICVEGGVPARASVWPSIEDRLRVGTLAHTRWSLLVEALGEAPDAWQPVDEGAWSAVLGPGIRRVLRQEAEIRAVLKEAEHALR